MHVICVWAERVKGDASSLESARHFYSTSLVQSPERETNKTLAKYKSAEMGVYLQTLIVRDVATLSWFLSI